MKKLILALILCATYCGAHAQSLANDLIERAIKNGIVLLRQDYQMLNEDDEPIGNKSGLDCYGRTYTCGVRVGEGDFLVTKEFVAPWWSNESIVKSEKRHPEVSYSGFLTLKTIDFEQFDCDVESAEEVIANHLYTVSGSESEGFELDEEYGKKRGYAVWLKSSNAFSLQVVPSGLTLDIQPYSVSTTEGSYIYDVAKQPTGNVIGGVFLVPSIKKTGEITIKVNGMFEKRGGVWKFISIGKEESIEE